jgi:hypothetical protein
MAANELNRLSNITFIEKKFSKTQDGAHISIFSMCSHIRQKYENGKIFAYP